MTAMEECGLEKGRISYCPTELQGNENNGILGIKYTIVDKNERPR